MPSWQSAFFARLNRLSGPRRLGARDAGRGCCARQYDRLSDRFGPIPGDAVFETAQLGPVKGEWVRVDASAPRPPDSLFPRRRLHRRLAADPSAADRAAVPGGRGVGLLASTTAWRRSFAFPGRPARRHRCLSPSARPRHPGLVDRAGGRWRGRRAGLCLRAGDPQCGPCRCRRRIVAMSPWADLSLTGWSMLQNARNDAALTWELLFVSARHYLKKVESGRSLCLAGLCQLPRFPADHGACGQRRNPARRCQPPRRPRGRSGRPGQRRDL